MEVVSVDRKKISLLDIFKLLVVLFFISLPLQCFFGEITTFCIMMVTILIFLPVVLTKHAIRINRYILYFTMFFLFACSSVFYSHELTGTGYVLRRLIPIFIYNIVVSLMVKNTMTYTQTLQFIKIVLKIYMLIVFFICVYLILFELPNIGIWGKLGSILFNDVGLTVWGYHLCFAMNFCLYYFLNEYFSYRKIGYKYLIVLFFMIICSYLSSIRKVFISPILFITIYFIIKNKKNWFKILKYTIFSIIMFIVTYYIVTHIERLYLVIGRRIESLILGVLNISNESSYIDISAMERESLRTNAISLFTQYPIFGYGLDSFKFYTASLGTQQIYSHINYLELLACTGLIGFTLYYGSFISMIKKLLKKTDKNLLIVAIVAILVTQLVLDLGSVTYYSSIYLSFYFLFSNLC